MNTLNMLGASPAVATSADATSRFRLTLLRGIEFAIALLATTVSLGIAAYAGWLRGGTLVQRTMIVAMAEVAVLYVHLIPMRWRAFAAPLRVAAGALWLVGIAVVMVGQATFFVESQRDAGNQRADSVPIVEIPNRVVTPGGRSLAEIAEARVKVVTDLTRIEARPCLRACPSVAASKAKLNAQLAALDVEAAEAKRREAEEDRVAAQVERDDALRSSLRVDQIALQIAPWFGTTASRLELVLAVAFAVVLEGAAVIGWMLVSAGRQRNCQSVSVTAVHCKPVAESQDTVAATALPVAMAGGAVVMTAEPIPTTCELVAGATADGCLSESEDDEVLDKIHAAVVAGTLNRSLAAIRSFLACGQARATRLNRLYLARFGGGEGRELA